MQPCVVAFGQSKRIESLKFDSQQNPTEHVALLGPPEGAKNKGLAKGTFGNRVTDRVIEMVVVLTAIDETGLDNRELTVD